MKLDKLLNINVLGGTSFISWCIYYLVIIGSRCYTNGHKTRHHQPFQIKRSHHQNPSSPYNQFYFTNQANSPHNVFSSLLTSPWVTPLSIKETCRTASDNRAGMCMPKKACLSSGGYVAGTCGLLGSCCVCKYDTTNGLLWCPTCSFDISHTNINLIG